MSAIETGESFDCFASVCTAHVTGDAPAGSAADAVALVRRSLLAWHEQFSRFLPDSELSRLNRDPRSEVGASPLMRRLAAAAASAGSITRGLVDATLIDQIGDAGYTETPREPVPLSRALQLAPPRRPARAASQQRWREIRVDSGAGTVRRPPGVKLDSGGLAKGLFADVLARRLAGHASFAINCAGDLAIGGAAGLARPVEVESPFDGRTLHTFGVQRGGVATSGIGRRSWLDAHGRPAHHLLDPSSGLPAYTGIVQVTALAPSALIAEIRAKAAILGGPRAAPRWLPDGGVIVLDDGSHEVIEPPRVLALDELAGFVRRTQIGVHGG
ncbi:MAG TPA: FAD:protein FMN transferase [Solirubrobacteraceae bacterium]|nr:FAD:protein FMN transferase [Solirubrobacteraceae bacterium]